MYVFGNANNGANAGLPCVGAGYGSGNAGWNIGGVLLNAYNGKMNYCTLSKHGASCDLTRVTDTAKDW